MPVSKRRVGAVGVALLLITSCGSPPAPSADATFQILEYAAGAMPASEGSAAARLGTVSSVSKVVDPAVQAAMLDSETGEMARHAGFTTVSDLIEVDLSGGVSALVGILEGSDLSRALLVDVGPENGGAVLLSLSSDAGRLLEISSPTGRVVLDADGRVVEQWDAHSSCRWSHCVGAALNFLVDLAVWDAIYWVLTTSCGLATDPDTLWTCEVTCAVCVASVLGAGYFLIPTVIAAVTDCGFDSCRWCYSDECGTADVIWSSCTLNLGTFDGEDEWVVMEAVDDYYCADPDEYSHCRTTPGAPRLVESCPYGCDPQGIDGTCAAPPPACDPATCEISRPLGDPYCTVRPDDGASIVVQDFEEQWCEAVEPRGETCVGADVRRVVEECAEGCATTGRACGSGLELRVYEPASGDAYVPCAGCRVRVQGVTGTFTGTTGIDGGLVFEGLAPGLYAVSYGCGPGSLGPHLPSDLVLHPDEPVTWVLARGPHMDPSVVLANIVAPAPGEIDVLAGTCAGTRVCSASQMSPVPTAQDLPEEVATTRREIVAAAVACDYSALAELSAWPYFAYGSGEAGEASEYWRSLEESGTAEPLRWIVETLNLPAARVEVEGAVNYVWPAAWAAPDWASVPLEEQALLVALYGEEISEDWVRLGGYARYRAAIGIDGVWAVFVTGD